jgi:ribosomal protein S18 acetylase RimI-like enzyme
MLNNIELMRFLYPTFTFDKYEAYLKTFHLITSNWQNDICVAVDFTAQKLWSADIEIDNFIVHPEHRSKGLGKMMTDYIDVKAKRRRL